MPVLIDEWESDPPDLYDPRDTEGIRPEPTYVRDSTIEVVEAQEIDVDITDYATGSPTITAPEDFLSVDGTRVLGTMPEGEDAFFTIRVRVDQ